MAPKIVLLILLLDLKLKIEICSSTPNNSITTNIFGKLIDFKN